MGKAMRSGVAAAATAALAWGLLLATTLVRAEGVRPQRAGNGGTPRGEMTALEAGTGEVAFNFWCRNEHDEAIHGFALHTRPIFGKHDGGVILRVQVDADDDGDYEPDWDLDDDGDGTLAREEVDEADSAPGRVAYCVHRGAREGGIPPGGDFRVLAQLKLPFGSGNWEVRLASTNLAEPSEEGPALGGIMLDTVKEASRASRSFTTRYVHDFRWRTVAIHARNVESAPIHAVLLRPPEGMSIAGVATVGARSSGKWNGESRTFTFATPIPPLATLGLNVTLGELSEDREFAWEVRY